MSADLGTGAAIAATDSAISGGVALKQANVAWRRQKRVLQNQIQWRVADLKAAGLNPILAAGSPLGGGAPSVSMARLPQNTSANMSKVAESSIKAAKKGPEIDAINQQANASGATAEFNRTKANLAAEWDPKTAASEIERNQATATQARNQAEVARIQAGLTESQMAEAKARSELFENIWTKRLMQTGMVAGEVITPIAAGFGGGLVGGAISRMRGIKFPKMKWLPKGPRTGTVTAPRYEMNIPTRPRVRNQNRSRMKPRQSDYTPEELWNEQQLNNYRFRKGPRK